jgi:hypothetical protein
MRGRARRPPLLMGFVNSVLTKPYKNNCYSRGRAQRPPHSSLLALNKAPFAPLFILYLRVHTQTHARMMPHKHTFRFRSVSHTQTLMSTRSGCGCAGDQGSFCAPGPAVQGRSSRAPSPARSSLDLALLLSSRSPQKISHSDETVLSTVCTV